MRSRSAFLIHPVFTGALALLLINDQLLKHRYSGVVTGKLSDVAGVVLIAVALSVVGGWRFGVAATAVGFVALKTLAPVAELVAPLLGGVTRRDPTDLVALVVLVPVGAWLRRSTPGQPKGFGRTALLCTATAGAVFATTATSCQDYPAVTDVSVSGELLYADVFDGTPMTSNDDGRTWTPVETSTEPAQPRTEPVVPTSPTTEACDSEGVCWRARSGEGLDRCEGGRCEALYSFSAEDRRRMDTQSGCRSESLDFLDVAIVTTSEGEIPIVAMGEQGVLVGDPGGSFDRVGVGESEPISLMLPAWTRALLYAPMGVVVASPLFLLALTLKPRRRAVYGMLVALLGGVMASVVTIVVEFSAEDTRPVGVGAAVAAVVILALSTAAALSPKKGQALQPPLYPPPPP
ncbi:MAG: hypothetical protein M3Q72_02190 [Actinomycetota bacterium]|nr:hypothetical protein [Actinomycetota bacterium]